MVSGHIIINGTCKPPALLFDFSFDQNMPRAPHAAPVLGPQREIFGAPEHITGKEQETTGGKTGPRSGSERAPEVWTPCSNWLRTGSSVHDRSGRRQLYPVPISRDHREESGCSCARPNTGGQRPPCSMRHTALAPLRDPPYPPPCCKKQPMSRLPVEPP
jgi:hypothetical protein